MHTELSVEGTDDVWFINFYSPRCSHCHELAPAVSFSLVSLYCMCVCVLTHSCYLGFNVLSIDFVRVTNCFYDYDYTENVHSSLCANNNLSIVILL